MQSENEKRIELEEQLKSLKQELESKVSSTAENAQAKQEELEKN